MNLPPTPNSFKNETQNSKSFTHSEQYLKMISNIETKIQKISNRKKIRASNSANRNKSLVIDHSPARSLLESNNKDTIFQTIKPQIQKMVKFELSQMKETLLLEITNLISPLTSKINSMNSENRPSTNNQTGELFKIKISEKIQKIQKNFEKFDFSIQRNKQEIRKMSYLIQQQFEQLFQKYCNDETENLNPFYDKNTNSKDSSSQKLITFNNFIQKKIGKKKPKIFVSNLSEGRYHLSSKIRPANSRNPLNDVMNRDNLPLDSRNSVRPSINPKNFSFEKSVRKNLRKKKNKMKGGLITGGGRKRSPGFGRKKKLRRDTKRNKSMISIVG